MSAIIECRAFGFRGKTSKSFTEQLLMKSYFITEPFQNVEITSQITKQINFLKTRTEPCEILKHNWNETYDARIEISKKNKFTMEDHLREYLCLTQDEGYKLVRNR